MITINKAMQGANLAVTDVAAAANAISTTNDKVSALLVAAQEANQRGDTATLARLQKDTSTLVREMVLTRARYHKAVEAAAMVKTIAELKQRAAGETDPINRTLIERSADATANALKKFSASPIRVALPAGRQQLNGLGGLFDSIGDAFKSVGSFVQQNAATIGAVAGTAIGAYAGGAQGAQFGTALGGTLGAVIQGGKQQVAQTAPAPGAPQVPNAVGTFNPAMTAAMGAGVPTGYGLPAQNFGVPSNGVPSLNPYANGYGAQQGGQALFNDPTQQLAQRATPISGGTLALYVGGGVLGLGLLGTIAYVALK